MELKVKEEFKDKYTGKVYKTGEILTVEKQRGEELLKSAYVVVLEKEANSTSKATKNNKKDVEEKQ